VADIPDTLVLRRHRDLTGRRHQQWWRRGILAVLVLIPVLALFNLFGQRPSTTHTTVPAASLGVYAPTHLRGGLLWEARFNVKAHQELKNAILVLGSGWLEGMTLNTLEPSPVGEASQNGKLALTLGHIPENESFLLFAQFQVNPTNVGRRSRTVWLYDGETRLTRLDQKVTVFP
jgi:hypothetical protein